MSANRFDRRKDRVRRKLRGKGKSRLVIGRSNQHMYAQIIDDEKGVTVASVSTQDKDLAKLKSKSNIEAAKQVGLLIAKKAVDAKVKQVVFDRGGFIYHGRVKALAEGAREGGLEF